MTIRQLVRNALRMRPDRIVVGEVRGAEALDMLQALNTGHEGSLTTVHANSPEDALRRVETLALMAGVGLPHAAVREQVASALDLVVHQARAADGARRVESVAEVVRVAGGAGTRELYRLRGRATVRRPRATGGWRSGWGGRGGRRDDRGVALAFAAGALGRSGRSSSPGGPRRPARPGSARAVAELVDVVLRARSRGARPGRAAERRRLLAAGCGGALRRRRARGRAGGGRRPRGRRAVGGGARAARGARALPPRGGRGAPRRSRSRWPTRSAAGTRCAARCQRRRGGWRGGGAGAAPGGRRAGAGRPDRGRARGDARAGALARDRHDRGGLPAPAPRGRRPRPPAARLRPRARGPGAARGRRARGHGAGALHRR